MAATLSKALLVAGLSVLTPVTLRNAPAVVLLPSLLASAGGLVTAGSKLSQAKAGDLGAALLSLGDDFNPWHAEKPEADLPACKVTRPGSVEDFLRGFTSPDIDPTTPDFWTPKRANLSAMLVGARGSGKSKLFAYRFQQCVAAGVRCFIGDLHYGADDDQPTVWLPGVNDAEFTKRFLLSTADDILGMLQGYATMVERRVSGESEDTEPCHLFIDEWGGCWRRWNSEQQERAINALKTIVDEGRKAKVNVSLSLHGLKKENDGIDSSLVQGCDLYLLGRTISDRSNQLPTDIDRNIVKERNEKAISIGVSQRALVHVDYLSGEAKVVVSPDLMTPLAFELEPDKNDFEVWLEKHRDRVEEMRGNGDSLRRITDALNVQRSKENPIYGALKTYLEEKAS